MTIGIAATGPCAGAGILAGLRAVEAVGQGAIGGFVSLAVLTKTQKLLRAHTQLDGSLGLFPEEPTAEILQAPFAALISSGPNRPEPLSQFLAAKPDIGLVTGHRFPHTETKDGKALNSLILEALERGKTAQAAIDAIISQHPRFDAGFIALSCDGTLGLGNMPSVRDRLDQGAAQAKCSVIGAHVATLHNAIHPYKVIADLANESALRAMRLSQTEVRQITLSAGLLVEVGWRPEIYVDDDCAAITVKHPDVSKSGGSVSFGFGDRVAVLQQGQQLGWLGHEPFIVLDHNHIVSCDGETSVELPVLTILPYEQ